MKDRSIEKIAIKLKIIQKVSNEERVKNGLKKIGKGYFNAYRFNPYNPLSYLIVLAIAVGGLLMYGVVGLYQKAENPFLWN